MMAAALELDRTGIRVYESAGIEFKQLEGLEKNEK
jgi:hypothetical protein